MASWLPVTTLNRITVRFRPAVAVWLTATLTGVALAAGPTAGAAPRSAVTPAPTLAPAAATPTAASGASDAARARAALAAVGELFGGAAQSRHGARQQHGPDATVLLRDLRRHLPALEGSERRLAQRYLARPNGGDAWYRYPAGARVTNDCVVGRTRTSKFCVYWARKGRHAPPLADRDRDRVPNQVETTRNTLNHVWSRLVTRGGYTAPPADGIGPRGYRSRFDVYLMDIGGDGLYGYCTTERVVTGKRATSYCVLDEDFARSQFPTNTPLGNLRVTGAHEFFHAVQFGIDWTEDSFFLENSSTWVEDEIYDGVNDNRNYLPASSLARPYDSLDLPDNWYGNWIWLRFLTETYPAEAGTGLPTFVRDVWTRAAQGATYSVQALAAEIGTRGTTLDELLADFATANRNPRAFYEEGADYPTAPAYELVNNLGVGQSRSGSVPLNHLASGTVRLRGFGAGQGLTVSVDAPPFPESLQAEVTVFGVDGSAETIDLQLDAAGDGSLLLPIDSSVARVELTLANGGRDYTGCGSGTIWACGGFRPPTRIITWSASVS